MKQKFTCKFCNCLFEVNVVPSLEKRRTFEFCSLSCRNKGLALKQINCPICGKLFTPRINDTGGIRKQFCSSGCGNYSRRGRASTNPNTHSKEDDNFVKKYYPTMGADWVADKLGYTKCAIVNLVGRLGIVLEKDTYYNRVHKAAQKYMTGEKNPNWHGGITIEDWGKNWGKKRMEALKRDNYTCRVCGLYSKSNSVHHIKPRRLFIGHMEDSNELSNLITLCSVHHCQVECGKIKCPQSD